MRNPVSSSRQRRLIAALAAVALVATVAACGSPAPAADGPGAVVGEAIAKVAAKDLDGLRSLACAGQEDIVRTQLSALGLPQGTDQLFPGLDMQSLLGAVSVDVAGLKPGDAVISGETAEVPVSGSVKVTFDAARMRPILKTVLEQQGASMADEQLDALLKTLESYGQDIPVDQSVRLVRENGAWKVCQETIATPGSS